MSPSIVKQMLVIAPPLSCDVGLATTFSLSIWILGLLAVFIWCFATLFLFPAFPISCLISSLIIISLLFSPLDIKPPVLIQRFFKFTLRTAFAYFPVRVIYEDKDAFGDCEKPCIIGYEPHGVLPQGMCAFCEYAVVPPPPAVAKARLMVSSAIFWAPIMRHLWYWLGCRPVSRSVIKDLLHKGETVALCPGGVSECLYMQPGSEVAYLGSRRGFIKLALEHGAPLVPVFAFGQSDLYSYYRPFLDFPKGIVSKKVWGNFARRIGFLPMFAWGVWGTPMPRRVPLTIVVGRPIKVPPPPPAPIDEVVVDEYLDKFIHELCALFERHKAMAGYPEEKLTVM